MKNENKNDRRNFLKAAGASLVAASLPLAVTAQKQTDKLEEDAGNQPQPVYLHGCGWNRSLPGVFGQACFTFEMRAEIGGTGVGTIRDDVFPEVNSQFQIHSATRSGRNEYFFQGAIIASRSPDLVGKRVTIVARNLGDGIGRASILVESDEDNLVVIAIIAVLIGLLLPAIQRTPQS
jgi:hypothetical protein